MLRRLAALAAASLGVGLLVGAVVLMVLAGTTSSRAFYVLEVMLWLGGLGCLVWAALGNRSKEKGAPRVSWPPAENPERKQFDELNQAIAQAPVDLAAVEAVVPSKRESALSQGPALERQVVEAFEAIGWSVTSTHLPGSEDALMVLEKDGLRVAVQCVVRPNGTVTYLELRQYFDLLDEAFRQGRIQKAILLTSGSFDAATAEAARMRLIQLIDAAALAQLDPNALTQQLLESAANEQRIRDLLEVGNTSPLEDQLAAANQAPGKEEQLTAANRAIGQTSVDSAAAEEAVRGEREAARSPVSASGAPQATSVAGAALTIRAPTDSLAASASSQPEAVQVPGSIADRRLNSLNQSFERQLMKAFEAGGWSVTSTDLHGAPGALMVLEKDGLRVAVQCVVRPNGTVSYFELRQYFSLLDEAFTKGRIQKGILVTSGSFDAATAEAAKVRPIQLIDGAALAQLDPSALTQQLLELEGAGARTREVLEAEDTPGSKDQLIVANQAAGKEDQPLAANEAVGREEDLLAPDKGAGAGEQVVAAGEVLKAEGDLLRQDTDGPQRVLTVGGVWFPPRGKGEEARVAFFRRLGTLCLLAGQDPYPVPVAALRDYLRIRGLVSPAASVLKMLALPRTRVNEGARAQAWLDTSTEAAEARADAWSALEGSLTLDAYIAKLRECLAASQNKSE